MVHIILRIQQLISIFNIDNGIINAVPKLLTFKHPHKYNTILLIRLKTH